MKTLKTLVLVLALVLVTAVGASAQEGTGSKAPGTWGSSINIQNPNDQAAEGVIITFFKSDGTTALVFNVDPEIPAYGSRSYYVPAEIVDLDPGQYSASISSQVELQVVANASSSDPITAGAYNGIQERDTSDSLSFPGLYNNYYGFHSELVIQNTDSTLGGSTNVDVSLRQGATEVWSDSFSIPSNASRVLSMGDITTLPSGDTAKFAATVSSDGEKLAGVANIWTGAAYGEFGDYNGYASGAGTVYAPALYNEYYGFTSALTVMNAGTGATNILVTYSNGATETASLAVGESVEYYQPNNAALPSGDAAGVFSAKVEATTTGGEVFALVTVEHKGSGLLASYNCPSESSTTVLAPVVLKEFYGWFSAVTVQNVGTAPTNVRITYADGLGTNQQFTSVAANGTVNIIQLASAGCPLADNKSVAATIESYAGDGLSAQPLVAVVQENSLGNPSQMYPGNPGDYLLAYTAVAQ